PQNKLIHLLTTIFPLLTLLFLSAACNQLPLPTAPSSKILDAVKIYTQNPGIYEITAQDLQNLGLSLDNLNPDHFQLFLRAAEQPLWTSGQGTDLKLRFYAKSSQSLYSRENVYWLVTQSGGQPPLHSPSSTPTSLQSQPDQSPTNQDSLPNLPPGAYPARLHLEENNLYKPQAEQRERWFWLSLAAPHEQDFEFELSAAVPGPAHLQVAVWGSTQAPASPDHHLNLLLNDQPVASQAWDGIGGQVIDLDLPSGLLRSGPNSLVLQAPGEAEIPADILFVDWIELTYPRQFVAENDFLTFTSPGGLHQLQGFSGPVSVYDLSGTHPPSELAGGQTEFEAQAGHAYAVVGPQGARSPLRLEPAQFAPDLRGSGQRADYVVVGPPDLLEPLAPLVQWREEHGLKVSVVSLQAVYDQFNAGFPEPQAIRAFMQYAAQHWQPAPRYLLLVGDATYDPRGYQSSVEANRLPVFLVDTIYGGQTASDVPFTQLDQDDQPDLAVGRVPARQADQVSAWVDKTLAYERALQASANPLPGVLAVADGQEAIFRSDAQFFLDLFPTSAYRTELYAPPAGASGASPHILDGFNQDNFMIAYFGHGSVNMWGKDRLFTTADVASLSNHAHLPVVLNMTCLNGLFTHPQVESMAEALLWQPQAGAVAVLAPTSLTLPTDQSFLSTPLVQALQEQAGVTLGEALLQARRQVPQHDPGTRDVMETFLLFGDPALNVRPAGDQ
ncbi:MAG: C25 family cysteine peptidase, partial [Anaerolineales bacterium]